MSSKHFLFLVTVLITFSCSNTQSTEKGILFGTDHVLTTKNGQNEELSEAKKKSFLSLFSTQLGYPLDSCVVEQNVTLIAAPTFPSSMDHIVFLLSSDSVSTIYSIDTRKRDTEVFFFGKTGDLFHTHYFAVSPKLNSPFVLSAFGKDSTQIASYFNQKQLKGRVIW